MKKRKIEPSLFVKFLFSYFLTLFLPLTLIIWFVFGNILHTLEKDLVQQNISRLSKTEFIVSSNIENIWEIRDQILMNPSFTFPTGLQNVTQVLTVMEEMKKYTLANEFLMEMAVYAPGDEYIYTSRSSWTVFSFLKQLYPSNPSSEAEFFDRLQQGNFVSTESCPGNTSGSILKAFPSYSTSQTPDYWIIFFIDKAYLETTLSPNSTETGLYAILGSDSEELVSVGQADANWNDSNLAWTSLNSQADYTVATIDKQQFLVCRVRSPLNDWQYLYALSEREAFEDMIVLRRQFLCILLVVVTVSFGIIFVSMQTNYKPMQRLKKHAEELLPSKASARNEITYIKDAFDQLITHNRALQAEVEETAKDHHLRQLLLGNLPAGQKIPFRYPYFCVMILLLDCKNKSSDAQNKVEGLFRTHVEGYLLQDSEQDRIIFIANPSPESAARWASVQQEIYRSLQQGLADCSIFLAASHLFNGIESIGTAYQQALLAAEYRFIRGNDCLVAFDSLKLKKESANTYPYALFEKLSNSVKTGNTAQMNELLDSFIVYIREGEFQIFYAKALSYELINIIYKVALSLGDTNFSSSMFNDYREKIDHIQILTDLVEAIRFFGHEISNYLNQYNSEKKKNLLYDIKACINAELHNSDFSVQSLAERFYMSPANISQYFKSKTGTTLISYITELRMTKAKELLVTTDLSLSEICEKIGYFNVSSFIRRFKQLYGITPRQYKEQQTSASPENDA